MPLPLPNLDTRRWADLVEEARALIPRYAPEWTDHNVHDPGITLVELLAWLVEQDVYRLNRVPDAHRRKFLALVGEPPRGPRAARAVLGLASATESVEVPRGAEFVATGDDGRSFTFCAVEPLRAVPASLSAVLVLTDPAGQPLDRTRLFREQGVAAFGDDPAGGAELWLGFDRPLLTDGPNGPPLRLALNLLGGRSGPAERRRILDEALAQEEACRRPLPPAPPCATPPAEPPLGSRPLAELPLHHSARLDWHFYGAGGWLRLDPAAGQVRDDTRALTLDGTLELRLPAETAPLDAGTGAELHFLMVRLAAGVYDAPPLLGGVVVNALQVEQAVPLGRTLAIRADATIVGSPPPLPARTRLALRLDESGQVDRLQFAADEAWPEVDLLLYRPPTAVFDGAILLDLVWLGQSSGRPGQAFKLPRPIVEEGSLELLTLEPPEAELEGLAPRTWRVRPDLDASDGRADDVVLDETRGQIRFGDGNQGRIPPRGAALLARYRATAAVAGNVRAGAIAALAPSLRNWLLHDAQLVAADQTAARLDAALLGADPASAWRQLRPDGYAAFAGRLGKIGNPRPAADGADAERLTTVAGRAVGALRDPTRAITAEDFEQLALATPGAAIARVRALPGRHPSFPCLVAPGVVTLIVVPAGQGARPTPSAGLLDAVRRYLRARRIVGTKVEVVGPRYLEVRVTAQVRSRPGASRERVRGDVLDALNAFLHPLGGGPAAIKPPARAVRPSAPPPTPVAVAPGLATLAPVAPAAPAIAAAPPLLPGWPFGRDVFRTEVLQVIDGVAGVDNVLDLELSGNGGPAQCGNLCVGPTELVVSGAHTVEVV